MSFVIPVRNDAVRLRRCLESLRANRYAADRIEIVVVDNGSTDGSAAVAEAARAIVLRHPNLPVGSLRNAGARAATGDLLAFVDADHQIHPEWVTSAVDTLGMAADAGAVGAPYEAPPQATWVQRAYDLLRARPEGIREASWLGAGNMVVRRQDFLALGGFDPHLQSCEDVDFCRRLRQSGLRILHDSRLRSVHYGDPSTLTALFRGELWRGRDNLRVSLRGELTLGELPSVAMPVVNLAAMAAAASGLGVAALTSASIGLWMAGAGVGAFLGVAVARTVQMVSRSRTRTWRTCGEAFLVAATYEAARALALVARAGHRIRARR